MEKNRQHKGTGIVITLGIAVIMIAFGALLLNGLLAHAIAPDKNQIHSAPITQELVANNNGESGEESGVGEAMNGFSRIMAPFQVVLSPENPVYGSGNEQGFYEIIENNDSSRNIMYTDYASLKQSYLCQNENCQHDSPLCNSYIEPSPPASIFPALAGDNLLVLYSTPTTCRIDTMSLDGSECNVLVDLTGTVDRIESGVLFNGDSIVINCASATNGLSQALIMVDVNTGEWTNIFSIKKSIEEVSAGTSAALFMLGVTDNGVIAKTIEVSEMPIFEDTDSEEYIQKTLNELEQHRVYVIPFDGTETKELLTYTTGQIHENVSGGKLFYIKDEETTAISLHILDTATGVDKVILSSFAVTPFERDMTNGGFGDYTIRQLIDDKLLINFLYSGEVNSRGDMVATYRTFTIDIHTGEMNEITLLNDYAATYIPVQIVTQIDEERLLVHAIIEEVPQDNSPIPRAERTLGIITIEDYLNSRPNYQLIDSLIKAF